MVLIYQERHLLSWGRHQVIDQYCGWYIIVDWCMSLLVWTLINCERLVHFVWKTWPFCYRLVVPVSYHKQAPTKSDNSFVLGVCFVFFNWSNISFFPFNGKFSTLSAWLNISSKVFKIESLQILNTQILTMSEPSVLFGLRFLMVSAISSLVNKLIETLFERNWSEVC